MLFAIVIASILASGLLVTLSMSLLLNNTRIRAFIDRHDALALLFCLTPGFAAIAATFTAAGILGML